MLIIVCTVMKYLYMKAVSELLCSSDNPAPDNCFVNISVRSFKFQFFFLLEQKPADLLLRPVILFTKPFFFVDNNLICSSEHAAK